jgi:hypothetical protein
MSSSSGNSLRASYVPRALGAGLAFLLASAAALAGDAQPFVFTAYSDAVGGADVVAGRYHAALAQLKSYPRMTDFDPAATNTNRCVAYSMTLQWRAARAACDAAVRASDAQPMRSEHHLAVAYSNRAVMFWLWNDDVAAGQDLARAQALAPRSQFVARNVAALRIHGAVALARQPAPKH